MVNVQGDQVVVDLELQHVELESVPREVHDLCGLVWPKEHGYVPLEHVPRHIHLPEVHILEGSWDIAGEHVVRQDQIQVITC